VGNEHDDTVNTPWMWTAFPSSVSTQWMVGLAPPLPDYVVDGFREMMVQTASVAIAAVESVDRQRAAHGKAFYENHSSS
jgi:hypothetical protein